MPKNRLEAFSDGVIAIVVTLLVLEIHVPKLSANPASAEMWRALWQILPTFAAYVISFLVCTVWWIAHHNFVHDLRTVNRPLLWLNNLFLLWLAFLPFPTALLGQYPTHQVAAAFYGFVCLLTSLCFLLMRWYASFRARLMQPEISVREQRRRLRISSLSPLLYMTGTLCSFFEPRLALVIYAVIPLYFAVTILSGGGRSQTERQSHVTR